MTAPTAKDVADFMGQGDDPTVVALAAKSLPLVTAMARSYTRGVGFHRDGPSEDLAAVITVATARMVANPEQADIHAGEVTVSGGFSGWSLAELFVLNRYRKRATG